MRAEIPLFERSHEEARRVAASGAPIYLTINPVEYHGPHLSLHNDRLISRALVRDLHARLEGDAPLLMGEDLEVGVEPCPGPGTRHTSYPILRDLVREACRALVELGARRVVLMTFHGAPLHNLALDEGVRMLERAGVRAIAPFHIVLREMLMLDDATQLADALAPIRAAGDREEMARELKYDFHAGFFETSMALHYAPSSVSPRWRELPPCPSYAPSGRFLGASRLARTMGRDVLARELELAAHGVGWNALRPFPGYTSRPHLASADSGAVFARRIVDSYAPVVAAVLGGRAAAPPPIMPWAGALSAGGRLGRLSRPTPSQVAALLT
jgi:creatinine amidohydrolase